MSEIRPRTDERGVKLCSHNYCPWWDRVDHECRHDDYSGGIQLVCYPAAIAAFADSKRLDWLNSHHFTAYHGRDPEHGLESHCVVVDEDQPTRR